VVNGGAIFTGRWILEHHCLGISIRVVGIEYPLCFDPQQGYRERANKISQTKQFPNTYIATPILSPQFLKHFLAVTWVGAWRTASACLVRALHRRRNTRPPFVMKAGKHTDEQIATAAASPTSPGKCRLSVFARQSDPNEWTSSSYNYEHHYPQVTSHPGATPTSGLTGNFTCWGYSGTWRGCLPK